MLWTWAFEDPCSAKVLRLGVLEYELDPVDENGHGHHCTQIHHEFIDAWKQMEHFAVLQYH